jgi:hypothetical protein
VVAATRRGDDHRMRHRVMARTAEVAAPGYHWPRATILKKARKARKREGRPR